MRVRPLEGLLDVRVLVDDASSSGAKSAAVEVGNSWLSVSSNPRPSPAAEPVVRRVRAHDRGGVDPELLRSGAMSTAFSNRPAV